jgi:hypothetical protein
VSDDGRVTEVEGLLERALGGGDARELEGALVRASGLPGARMNLGLAWAFARAVGGVVVRPGPPAPAGPPVGRLEALLDGWAALTPDEAPGDQPRVILPCAAHAAYGEVGAVRPEWWRDETAKLRRGASDTRWRVREVVAQALQRLIEADGPRTFAVLQEWAGDDDPFVVRAATAGVAEPRLLREPNAARAALDIQRRAVDRYRAYATHERRRDDVRALRQALGFAISVAVAATRDVGLLDELAASDDKDLQWIARQNEKKARLKPIRAR